MNLPLRTASPTGVDGTRNPRQRCRGKGSARIAAEPPLKLRGGSLLPQPMNASITSPVPAKESDGMPRPVYGDETEPLFR